MIPCRAPTFFVMVTASCCFLSVVSSKENNELEQNIQRAAQSGASEKCCSDNCASYRGEQSTTIYGSKCLNWYDLPDGDPYHPDKHPNSGLVSNYCRNPGGDWRNAWCYTRIHGSNWKPDWENCGLPNCTASDSEKCCDADCTSYRGKLSTSKSGKTCLPWADLPKGHKWHPNRHPNSGLESNYCRNPDGWSNAWCVTKIKGVEKPEWENCAMPFCLARDPGECCEDNCASYRGKQNKGYQEYICLPWKDLPADHPYHPDKHPNSGLESNYCRNPDGWRNAWCFIQINWPYGKDIRTNCALPNCTASKSEMCCDGNCVSYRGKFKTGIWGSKCLPWKNLPPTHKYNPNSRPDAGLESNYCRNPSGYDDAWCYTYIGKPNNRWEACTLPQCSTIQEKKPKKCKAGSRNWQNFFCGETPEWYKPDKRLPDKPLYYGCEEFTFRDAGYCWIQSGYDEQSWYWLGRNNKYFRCNLALSQKDSGKYCYEHAQQWFNSGKNGMMEAHKKNHE